MIILFWLMLILLAFAALAAAGILIDPELAASQLKSAARRAFGYADRGRLSHRLDWLERHARIFAFLLLLLVDGEAATR